MYKRSLFIFRQDLRTHDNTALIEAMQSSEEVFPIFIHDIRAIEDFGEHDPRFGLVREALEAINSDLSKHGGRLTIYRGRPEEIVMKLIETHRIDAIFVNRSYSPRGKERDDAILKHCDEKGIDFHSYQDFLLVEPHEVEQRKVFTPFSLLWKKYIIAHPERLEVREFEGSKVRWFIPEDRKEINEIITVPHHKYWTMALGRERMKRDFSHYDELRNLPAVDGSTRLSPYIRFGIFSVREVISSLRKPALSVDSGLSEGNEDGGLALEMSETPTPLSATKQADIPLFQGSIHQTLLSELIWREFWYHIAYYFPFTYHIEFQERRRLIDWNRDESSYEWQRFQEGKTGYPLVDAAIRQLIETGWMHNRLRMVVASFLTKNLGIDWRMGERWFRKYLIDYDEAVNFGNWQWSASVGADPKPVRIFNPLLQSEKFDAECKFIKKYIPELESIDPKRIHSLDLKEVYVPPLVDQKESAARARERYRN